MNFIHGSRSPELVPSTIIEDVNADFWRVCWEPDHGGVITREPSLVRKPALAARYPHVVAAWEANQRDEQKEAREIEQRSINFARFLNSDDPRTPAPLRTDPGVACDQSLLPGMNQHWGELRLCESHSQNQPGFHVCKGCRVSHHMQEDRGFDRKVIMARGARVPVCGSCAAGAVEVHGVGHRGCVCDSQWSCCRCRESKLRELAKARRQCHRDGRCGRCAEEGDLVENVDICLYCRRLRVYAASL